MIHSGQKTMSQPLKNHEMLKLYTLNLSLSNPKEQCNSRVPQHNPKHCANIPLLLPAQAGREHPSRSTSSTAATYAQLRSLVPAQVIGPSSHEGA